MMHKIVWCNQLNRGVILLLVIILCLENPIQCVSTVNGLPKNDSFVEKCEQTCRDQVKSQHQNIK